MGAKTCLLAYSKVDIPAVLRSAPAIDRGATRRLVETVFSTHKLSPLPDVSLADAYPIGNEVYAGVFDGVAFISANDFTPDRPSKLLSRYLAPGVGGYKYLHAMHSVVDWFAYAVWRNGSLIRSLSVSPDNGVIEDVGERRPFEDQFWAEEAERKDSDDDDEGYPFGFLPVEFGEAALLDLF